MASKGFFADFFPKIQEYIDYVSTVVKTCLVLVETILNIKAEVKQSFTGLVQEFRDALKESTDFADRIKNLRSKAIRADVVYQFIEDLRTGELKRWFEELVETFHSELSATFDAIAADAIALKIFKNPASGVVKFLAGIAQIFIMIDKAVKVLHGLLPVVQALGQKLAEFEKVIMKQNNPRIRLKKTISARAGKLHDI